MRILAILFLLTISVMTLACIPYHGKVQLKIRKDPVQFVDASTGETIQELLAIPRYNSFKGVATLFGEGPQRGTYRDYLANPFIYNPNSSFNPNQARSTALHGGLWAYPFKGISLEGVMIIAPGYQPYKFIDFWPNTPQRRVKLSPISSQKSAQELQKISALLRKDKLKMSGDECYFWDLSSPCILEIRFKPKERELVHSFLQQSVQRLNQSP
jgi:hypothetical protein